MKHFIKACLVIALLPLTVYPQYSEYDWEERDSWMPLDALFKAADVQAGQYIADIGCHEGYLTVRLAKRVGAKGKVFAVDVRADRLEALKDNLKERQLTNVNVIHGDYDNPKLPKGQLDVVYIVDTYHEMTDYMDIIEHVKASLKPKGKIVIFEKLKSRIKGKSRDEQTDAHSLSIGYVKDELQEVGFKIVYENKDLGDWEKDPDKVMWMVVAEKSE